MRISNWLQYTTAIGAASAFECSPSAFIEVLPSNATVTFAYPLSDNSTFQVPAGNLPYRVSPTGLRALCAVEIRQPSSGNSSYSFGLFLPAEWNGRFLAVGNGGFGGGINWADMGVGVGYGFATISTDTGHNSSALDASWAYNAPEKVEDWGYRALHGSIVLAKEVVSAYYGKDSAYSYYSGCSTGGRQGFKEAQEFPDDFDGIVAGAPAWWTTHLQLWNMKVGIDNLPQDAPHHIPRELFPVIADEVLKQCDPQDGVVDTVISDPTRCNFNPEALLCPANVTNGTAGSCLTVPQIGTLYRLHNPWYEANQTLIFPPFELGSEAEWDLLVGGPEPATLGTDYVKYMLGEGPEWRWQDFNASVIALSDRINPGNATADNFDLSPFYEKGGKLLHYHGLSDGSIATGASLYLYNQILKTLEPNGIELDPWYRMFLVPGLQHCVGTPSNMNAPWYFAGPNQARRLGTSAYSVPGFSDAQHDVLLAMMAWVENGTAPDQIIATKWENDTLHDTVERQRPICAYPKQAMYSGEGDEDEAENWRCESLY
ncbi:hypothetical protein W97_03646 [Coniosporium apollinis CBS 100218]|uniref:Carboxylic ester hydrolase n=1 Tax=Coniosporium apollinis (strain CBS 100218) TaxID=1168221 RepID=R7YR64_CONA1|nr:uncharacterized protein W97_03646 [Coniosporium apollinis CBS 100218]EON64415.1 hypothetical protein W97_03646 [Coniosporium apollinis CBS 100218]